MDRLDAIDRSWSDVEAKRIEDHGCSEGEARQGLEDDKHKMDEPRLGEVVYDRGEDEATRVIRSAMEGEGFPTPSPAPG